MSLHDTVRELNDELCAVGEAILGQMADEHGRDEADEKFHEWNDVVHDICHRAFERDDSGNFLTIPSPTKDPLEYLHYAKQRDLAGLEARIEKTAEDLYRQWERHAMNPVYYQTNPSVPVLPASGQAVYSSGGNYPTMVRMGSFTANVPHTLHPAEAKFLIKAQVREAVEQGAKPW